MSPLTLEEELLRVNQHPPVAATLSPTITGISNNQKTINALVVHPTMALSSNADIKPQFVFGRGGPFDSVVKAFFPKSFGKKP